MAYCTVSIGDGVHESRYGKSQFPIKSYLEKRGEAFEQASVLKKLYRMQKSHNWGEKFTGDTAMNNWEPVGEGGKFPSNGFEEGFAQTVEHMVWKSMFSVTREMADDNKIGSMKNKANAFITAYNRTRELFGRQLYVGGLKGTKITVNSQVFDCCSADKKALFAKDHPAKVKGDAQSNLFADDISTAALGKLETRMQNTKGDNGELLAIQPDTIWIPNDAVLKNKVFEAIGSDKDPATANNGFNYQYGRWNVIVDPYLNLALERLGIKASPWILLDSSFIQEQDGPVWLDRIKMEVKSDIDPNNWNNVWQGYGRFGAGFVDWRFCAVGGMTGGTAL